MNHKLLALATALGLALGGATASAAPLASGMGVGGPASAADPTFDELGNSDTYTSIIAPDPTGGVAGNVLIYLLPGLVTAGDARIFEDASRTTLSDLLRFTNAAGQVLNPDGSCCRGDAD